MCEPHGNTMNALVWLGPREMVLRPEPLPQVGPDEVLIEVTAVGICGSELGGYLGHNSLRRPPLIMGHEGAGRLVTTPTQPMADGSMLASGARVTFNPLITCGTCDRCRVGLTNLCRQRQLIGAARPGAFAQYVAVPAGQCWPLSDQLSDVAGSLAEPLACAVRAVEHTAIKPDQTLLILGAGPIGLCCLATARAKGIASVLVSDVSPQRLQVAADWGAQTTINAHAADVVAVVQVAHPGGVDAVIDAVGATATRAQAIQAVVPGGRVVLIGLHDEESLFAANYVVRQEITITGSFGYIGADFAQALHLLEQGTVRPSAAWLEERPLSAGPDAFTELVNGTAQTSKIVLCVA